MSCFEPLFTEDTLHKADIDPEISEIKNGLDKEVKECVPEGYTIKEYFDKSGIYHFHLIPSFNDSEEDIWDVFDYGSDSALLDLEFMPEDI